MAGGREYVLQRKMAAVFAFTNGSEQDGNLRHWRRDEVVFEIAATQQGAFRGNGDLGDKSGLLAYSESAGAYVTDQASSRCFICEGDDAVRADEASGFYIRTQIWRKIGPDREYDPATGLDL
jgi:hypothetical protein